jgi:hypothetical protein
MSPNHSSVTWAAPIAASQAAAAPRAARPAARELHGHPDAEQQREQGEELALEAEAHDPRGDGVEGTGRRRQPKAAP